MWQHVIERSVCCVLCRMRPWRKAENVPPSCVVMESANINFLEPFEPLQACNGTALSFLPFMYVCIHTHTHTHLGPLCIWQIFYKHVFWRTFPVRNNFIFFTKVSFQLSLHNSNIYRETSTSNTRVPVVTSVERALLIALNISFMFL
jgi:hypothetical protein